MLGNLYRNGKVECVEAFKVYDHDFPQLAQGVIRLYTIYDIIRNEAYVHIGTSNDTADFVSDAISAWWNDKGKLHYPKATSILCLADGGGSNSSRHHVFKESLQRLVSEINIPIRMAHYPPYASKWNPVEHKVFPHITRAMAGVVLESMELVKKLVDQTTTLKGLNVFSKITDKFYETGRKVCSDFYEWANIKFDTFLMQWNYVVGPINII